MTPEQLERLKERRNEIITVAMGRCWHINTDGEYCNKCGKYVLDEDSLYFIPLPDYSTPEGWGSTRRSLSIPSGTVLPHIS